MDGDALSLPVVFATTVPHILLAAGILVKPAQRQAVRSWLFLYLITFAGWVLAQGLLLTTSAPTPGLLSWWRLGGVLFLDLNFLYLSYAFLHQETAVPRWWRWAVAWGIIILLIDGIVPPSPSSLPPPWETISSPALILWGVAWIGLMAGVIRLVGGAYRRTGRRPLHRNRLRYWVLVGGLLLLSDLFFLVQSVFLGLLLRALLMPLLAYATLTYRLLDLRAITRRALADLLALFLVGVVYLAALLWAVPLRSLLPDWPPLLFGSALAALLLLGFNPLRGVIHRLVNRLGDEIDYDPNRTLREYSATISKIVDLSELEATAVSLISEAMEISYGTLFLVEAVPGAEGETYYQLVSAQGLGVDKLALGRFAPDSPVAAHLSRTHRPLTQYDIDMMPQFQETAAAEQEWLAGLGLEVYVPIYAQGSWIGLLGLGAKMSGNRYFDDDLLLLSTLADQTAVALENARLVADLVRLNRELEAANRRLHESDQLKTDFIGTITHELRTPFANIDFALQLLQQEGTDNLTASQQEELAKVARGVTQARAMVNDLVTFAAFLSKQGQLQLSCFDLREKVAEAIRPLQPLADNKEIALRVNGVAAPLPVRADRERITEAMHHLLHNAIKFTDRGGAIHVRAWQEVGAVHFEVQDDGKGIPEEKLEGLWEGFSQMADPVRRGAEGVGLGLPLVKYIVNAHRGNVYAHSEETVGSTFGFHIPAESTAVRPHNT